MKKIEKGYFMYFNKKGEAVGVSKETDYIESKKVGSKPIELTETIEAVSGKHSEEKTEISEDVYEKVSDPNHPLGLKDFKK